MVKLFTGGKLLLVLCGKDLGKKKLTQFIKVILRMGNQMVKEHPLTEWEESMLGRLIKAPDQLLHVNGAVPAKN